MTALRRYLLPGAATAAAYLLLGYLFTPVPGLYWLGLLCALLLAYYMRLCDDLLDFEKDAARGKAPLGKGVLIALTVTAVLILSALSVAFSLYWLLLPAAIISVQFCMKERFRNFLKPLFLPGILIALFHTVFAFDPWIYPIILAAAAVDVLIIIGKERKHDTDR